MLGDLEPDHDHVGEVEEVGVADEPALGHVLVSESQVIGVHADDVPLDFMIEVAEVLAELADRGRALDRGDGLDDPVEVLVRQAELQNEAVVVLLREGLTSLIGFVLRTITFVAPSSAICRWASALAPSAIDSMAMTDDTPKISPSIVSKHAQLVQRQVADRQEIVLRKRCMVGSVSQFTWGVPVAGSEAFGRLFRILAPELRIGSGAGVEGHALALLQAFEDLDEFFIVFTDLDLSELDPSGLLDECVELSLVLGNRPGWERPGRS